MKTSFTQTMIAILAIFALSSCSKEFYQVLTAESQSVETQQTGMVYEDENCKITYNLWAPHGNAGFIFYNKTDKNIIVDLKECFFIFNGYANDYYLDRTYVYGKSTRAGIGKSFGKSANYSETLSGTLSSTLYRTWADYDTSTSKSTSESVSGAIGVSQNNSAQVQSETNASVEIKEQDLICIPPKTAKLFYEYQILGNIYRECGFFLFPKKSEIKRLKYVDTNSPIKFSNVISYRISEQGNPIVVNNDFYISGITNISAGEFITEIRVEKDCMGKSYEANEYKTVYKEQAPNKFYIRYVQNARNSDKY